MAARLFRKVRAPEMRFSYKRTRMASLLFAALDHRAAKAASVNADSVKLTFGGLWPKSLPATSEFQMLMKVQAFLDAPDEARAKANGAYIAKELDRWTALFDRIEAWPMTDEQRKAVVIDERRNLVIAAAGSGKTSVILAKAVWLVIRESREPSQLLLLAYARNA